MLKWFAKILREEFRSMASVSFFLVLALTMGAATSWVEHGKGAQYLNQGMVAGTSTSVASLPAATP